MKRLVRFFGRTRCAVLLLTILILMTSCASGDGTQKKYASTLEAESNFLTTTGLLNPDSEIRGVWIATVGNINYPSKKGLSAAKLKAELDAIVENCSELGINTIFFQVRPAADALYRSELFPSSEFVSGEQGKAPEGNFDSLAYLIEIANAQKINVHAWVNPLRVTYGSVKYPKTDVSALAEGHIARKNPDWVIAYDDGKLYFDAGNPAVREYIALGVKEIVENYAVDGVVFDDYFYPYPTKTDGVYAVFDDDASYSAYGNGAERDDWRRDNINKLVKACYDTVKNINKECLFGISPFGIWRNGEGGSDGSATAGLEAYESLYCDAISWAEGGYVDYLAPQLYWRFITKVASYGVLSDWWNSMLDGTGVKLLISHAAYMYEEWETPAGELTSQIEYSREALAYRGSVLYGYAAITADAENIKSEISELFSDEIIYSDPTTNFKKLYLLGISDGMTTSDISLTVSGRSDPSLSLEVNGERVNRNKDGSFTIELSLLVGENRFVFKCGEDMISYTVTRTKKN